MRDDIDIKKSLLFWAVLIVVGVAIWYWSGTFAELENAAKR
jgi:hypothetical protein